VLYEIAPTFENFRILLFNPYYYYFIIKHYLYENLINYAIKQNFYIITRIFIFYARGLCSGPEANAGAGGKNRTFSSSLIKLLSSRRLQYWLARCAL